MFKSASLLTAAAVCGLGTAAHADVFTNFEGGPGNVDPNQYVGAAGDGWVDAWSDETRVSSSKSAGFSINTTSPIAGTYDMLATATATPVSSGFGATRANNVRQWQTDDGVSPAGAFVFSYEFKVTTFDTSSKFGDYLTVYLEDNAEASGTFNNAAAGFRLRGEENTFQVRSTSGNTTLSDVDFALNTVYTVTATVDMVNDTFDFTLEGNSQSQTLTGLGLNSSLADASYLHVGTSLQSANADNGGTTSTINAQFDNISFTAIPEPSSMALIGLGTLCLLGRSRKASV